MTTVAASTPLALADSLGIDDLRDLMSAVTQTTERLQSTHVMLQQQVSRLQHELAEANAALRRSQSLAALGEMAAGIAHEVRNPLASIQLYAEMLGDDLANRPDQAEVCHKIIRAVIGLDAIVRDVLSFARNTTIHPELISVDELFDRALTACDAMIRCGGFEIIREDESGDGLVISADPVLLTQALGNIIRNAIEAMMEAESPVRRLNLVASHRRVRCPGGKTAPRTTLSITDTGPGIPNEVLDRIFNPFFTTRKTGTGLGLAIVHRIVDAHGGHINIHSEPGQGTQFEVCLPSESSEQSQAAIARSFESLKSRIHNRRSHEQSSRR